jgi:glycosyltransferase involved in cell wall biosynthesis
MNENRHTIICLDTRCQTESRHQTLFESFNKHGIEYNHIITKQILSRSSIAKRLSRKHYILPHIFSLIDASSIFIDLFPLLVRSFLSSLSKKKLILFVCFNSWYFYPYAYLLSFFPKVKLVIDLGYPFQDVSTIGFPSKFKSIISFLEKPLLTRPLTILLESQQQVERLSSIYNKPIFYPYHVIKSSGLSVQAVPRCPAPLENINPIRYILFRGTLNRESGIKEIVKDFLEYCELDPLSNLKLYIYGRGEYSEFVEKVANEETKITYCDTFLDNKSLTELILSAVAMVGQFGVGEERLAYTIPHKYIESIMLRKLYLSPISQPLYNYYSLLLNKEQLNCLSRSSRPMLYWLSLINDPENHPSTTTIDQISTLIERELVELNNRSLSQILT